MSEISGGYGFHRWGIFPGGRRPGGRVAAIKIKDGGHNIRYEIT